MNYITIQFIDTQKLKQTFTTRILFKKDFEIH